MAVYGQLLADEARDAQAYGRYLGDGVDQSGLILARYYSDEAEVFASVIDPGLPQVRDPFDIVTVRGLATTPGVVVDSWDFAVEWSNPKTKPVTFTQLVNVVTYEAPATQLGTVGTWTVTAHVAGYPDTVATVTHSIRGHCVWQFGADGKYRAVNTRIAT